MSFWLVMKTAGGRRRPFPIREEGTVIGREVRSDVRIPIPGVAPRHCEIHFSGDELLLKDLGSPLGILHNGHRVREAVLADADQLTIGPVTFELKMDREGPGEPRADGEVESKPIV